MIRDAIKKGLGRKMILNTDHLKRCIGTLESSLAFYQKAEPGSIDQEVFRNAIVKGYELAQETAFKLIKRALKDYPSRLRSNSSRLSRHF
jgi:hypothetical protein